MPKKRESRHKSRANHLARQFTAACLHLIATGSTVINEGYLHLLIVEESENDAESLANILRNAGYSIRFDHSRDAEAFESALDAGLPDIVLCGTGEDVISTDTVQGILAQRELATPVIAVVEDEVAGQRVRVGAAGRRAKS